MRSLEWFARDRIGQFRRQAVSVGESDSLFPSSEEAIEVIKEALDALEALLDKAVGGSSGDAVGDDDPLLQQACVTVNQKLSALTTYLGVILRSSNTRNSFEYYFALNEIATHFTGNDKRLILSSEWEYSPFFIPQPPDALRDFVFIGFPAYLSRNSLLLPLAAHELAHAIWRVRGIEGPVYSTLDLLVGKYAEDHSEEMKAHLNVSDDLFAEVQLEAFRGEVLDVAMKQAEEVFCDLFGVALFRESYIYAFNSFVLPGSGAQSGNYPTLSTRLGYMTSLAIQLKLDLKTQPKLNVEPITRRRGPSAVADAIIEQAVTALTNQAKTIAAELSFHEGESAADIRANFRNLVPALAPRSPVEVLNATWDVYLEGLEKAASHKERHEKFRVMNNLCLKSLETYEISVMRPFK